MKHVNSSALALTGAALSLLVLAGCGSSSKAAVDSSPTSSTTATIGAAAVGAHNQQDETFLIDMIPHHTQAVEMADMALSRDTDADVKALAAQIKAAQGPEISQMSGYLVGWGKTVPSGTAGHSMGGMGSAMNGMMSGDEMTQLDAASGNEFAKLFLMGMTKHHKGAVEMAKTELAEGKNADAQALATKIISAQDQEITTMAALLTKLGG